MAFDRTSLLEDAEPALYDRGWTTTGLQRMEHIASCALASMHRCWLPTLNFGPKETDDDWAV
jgi:hypothetical protein